MDKNKISLEDVTSTTTIFPPIDHSPYVDYGTASTWTTGLSQVITTESAEIQTMKDTLKKIQDNVQSLQASIKKPNTATIVVKTMKAYTKLLTSQLNSVSANKDTQAKLLQLIERIENKIMEVAINEQENA